jgi:hypothetical protein
MAAWQHSMGSVLRYRSHAENNPGVTAGGIQYANVNASALILDVDDGAVPSDVGAEPYDLIVGEDETSIVELLETYVVPSSPGNAIRFSDSRKRELDGLLEAGGFTLERRQDALDRVDRVFGCRFVGAIKNYGTDREFDKSRLVVQGFNEQGAKELLTKAPTVSRNTTRLLVALAASSPGKSLRLRDISTAYLQAETKVVRRIGISCPKEMGLGNDFVLVVVRPLYGFA